MSNVLDCPRRSRLWLGVGLMALSFGIYPAYPMVVFLPISRWDKAGVAVGLAAVSWSMFFAGSVFVGKKSLAYLKERVCSRSSQSTGGPPSPSTV